MTFIALLPPTTIDSNLAQVNRLAMNGEDSAETQGQPVRQISPNPITDIVHSIRE